MKQRLLNYCLFLFASAICALSPAQAAIITNVVETDGDNEATDTIPAVWTGRTFTVSVAGEPVPGIAVGATYTVGVFGEEAPMFVDRNHQWNGGTTTLPLPPYLVGAEYIVSGNDNRDNPTYKLDITISQEAYVYMLIDNRVGDAAAGNPPNFTITRTGAASGADMSWIVDQGWQPVRTGQNRSLNPDLPDEVGADEGGNGVGPGGDIQNWSSVYVKRFPTGTVTILQPDNNGQNMYGVVVKAVPDDPFLAGTGGTIFGFNLQLEDGGKATVNPAGITATLNGASISPLAVTKTNFTTTIAYTSPNAFPPGSTQTVVVTYRDNSTPARTLTSTGSFVVESYVDVLPSWAVADVDTTKRGFLVRTHQLDDRRHVLGDRGTRIAPAEKQLAGLIGPSIADPAPFTSNGFFIEDTYINYNQDATTRNDGATSLGLFGATTTPAKNENPVPGIPGPAASTDHVAVEALTYVELPAGLVTMGVNSDDGFRLTISPIGVPAGKLVPQIASFDAGRGAASTEARFVVQQAGRYAMRLMWYEGTGGFNAEWYTVQANGTRVLVNDPAEASAVKAYYARTGPQPAYVSAVDPFPIPATAAAPATAFPDDPLHIEITDGATAVQTNSILLKVNGQTVTPTALTRAGTKTTVQLTPPGGVWPSGANVAVELNYTHSTTVTQSWTVPIMTYVTLQDCLRTAPGTGQTPSMRWRTHQLDQTATRANTVAAAEAQLLNPANTADLSAATAGFFNIDYVNFEQAGLADGLIGDTSPAPRNAPELFIPGIPGVGTVGNTSDNIAAEALTFLEFPRAGVYYMGVNKDDGFLLTVATSEGGRSLVNGPNVQEIGRVEPGGGTDDNNLQSFMPVYVSQGGVWPFRLMWFEGNGGASVEWFQTDKRAPIGLVNDPAITSTLRAFRARTAQPAATNAAACSPVQAPPTVSISSGATGLTITFQGILEQANEAAGPYAVVAGANSPQAVTASDARKFYRARR